jgi:uncharacterized protein
MLKAIVHCNFDDAERQENGLRNIRNMLADVNGHADIAVVCHGPGISLLLSDENPNAEDVAELLKKKVAFLACQNTLESKSLAKDKLIAGVQSVSSGAVEVVRRQQDGYGYFHP